MSIVKSQSFEDNLAVASQEQARKRRECTGLLIKSLQDRVDQAISKYPNRYQPKWTEDSDYRQEHEAQLIPLGNQFKSHALYGTNGATIELYGYRRPAVIKFVDLDEDVMYCEVEDGTTNLHYQEMEYGPEGRRGWGGTLILKSVPKYIPILYNLDTFQAYQLNGRFDTSFIRQNLKPLSVSILRALLTQNLNGDQITKGLLSKVNTIEQQQEIKKFKIISNYLGGRMIYYSNDILIPFGEFLKFVQDC